VWGSFFAVTNVVLFRFLALDFPATNAVFRDDPRILETVYGWLCGVLSGALVVGWVKFDLPSAWQSLSAGSLTVATVRLGLVTTLAGGTIATVLDGGSPGLVSGFPFLSLVLSIHALLCVWASRVVATHSGVHLRELLGVVNIVPRGTVLGSTETHDKIARVAELQCGDLMRLKRGQIVPCDAFVEQGIAEVEERCYSGFAELRMRGEGQRLFAGSVVRAGEVLARVENVFADSVITNFTSVLDDVLAKNRVPERWESLAHAVVLFLAACAGIHFFRSGVDGETLAGAVGGVLSVALFVDFLAYLPLLRGVALTRAFERGVLCGTPRQLDDCGRIRSLVIDHVSAGHSPRLEIGDLTIFDERLDSNQLVSALLSVLGRTDKPFGVAAVEYLRGRVDEPVLHDIRDFTEYPERGISALVGGAEFSIGSELFLIDRGVQIQSSEVEDAIDGHPPVYVAIGDEVAARFTVVGGVQREASQSIDALHRLGIRALLMSQEPREVVDPIGKEMTLELGQITGGLSVGQYVDRVKTLGAVALAGSSATPANIVRAATVALSKFDEVRFNLDPRVLTVFRSGLAPLVEICTLGRRLSAVLTWGWIGGAAGALGASFAGVASGAAWVGLMLALLAPVAFVGATRWLRRVGEPAGSLFG
jgi:cation transport ATPase